MYIPKLNRMENQTRILDFMKRFSFATIVTSAKDVPVASHLPILAEEHDGQLVLLGHFARQNEQWRDIGKTEVLVIFQEPHAYISPVHYEREMNVPTWNYIAVHAYGRAQLETAPGPLLQLLEKTIRYYEAPYLDQWNRLPEKYREGMLEGIVGFRVEVSRLQAREKLSQNRSPGEQQTIVRALEGSPHESERLIADYMKGNLEGNTAEEQTG